MKRCKSCRGALIPKSRETRLQFERRDYCSRWCQRKIEKDRASAGRGYHTDHSKVCPTCGEIYYRPRNKTVEQFEKRKACSQSCAAKRRAKRRQREILLEAEREAGRVTEEQRAQGLEEVKSEVNSLNYYLQARRERQEEQWRRQLWQAMLQAPRR